MMSGELGKISEVMQHGEVMVIKPGDKIIFRAPSVSSQREVDRLYKMVGDFFGEDAKNVMIVSKDIEISVLRQEAG